MHRTPLGQFLARNPYPNGLTDGLFYREKMRAIHRVAPEQLCDADRTPRVLDIGGGRSGLAQILYPTAQVVTVDLDPKLAGQTPPGAQSAFACADACRLPFADGAFDAVCMFDVLEHIPRDDAAAAEALRVTRPGGAVVVSTPRHTWRYPFYAAMRRVCPPEAELMSQWGHVRRGYAAPELQRLFGQPPARSAGFINALTAFAHDVSFSRLGRRRRKLLYLAAAPLTAVGYFCHHPLMGAAETAATWRR